MPAQSGASEIKPGKNWINRGPRHKRMNLVAIVPRIPPGGTGMMAPDTFLEINNGRRNRADAYVEWDRTWTSAWTSQVGVRSDTVMMDTGKVHGYNAMYDAAPLFPATRFNDADRSRVDPNWDVTAQAVYTPDLTETYSFGYSRKTRSPNLYERYSWSPDTMAAEMIGWFGDGIRQSRSRSRGRPYGQRNRGFPRCVPHHGHLGHALLQLRLRLHRRAPVSDRGVRRHASGHRQPYRETGIRLSAVHQSERTALRRRCRGTRAAGGKRPPRNIHGARLAQLCQRHQHRDRRFT
jgi:hypothetical protein